MFCDTEQLIEFFKMVADIKNRGEKAYVVYDFGWFDVMDKEEEELEQFVADQIDSIDPSDDKKVFDYLNSLNLNDLSSIKEVLKVRYFELIEI